MTGWAGQDRAGQVYLLASPADFRFLRQVHPPRGIDSTNVAEYAYLSLVMTGKILSAQDTLESRVERLPAGAAMSTDTSIASRHPTARLVWVTIKNPPSTDVFGVLVELDSGEALPLMEPFSQSQN